ncbi:MAG: T9SS type A sorting domain-containing protein [Anaerolineales bacterium]
MRDNTNCKHKSCETNHQLNHTSFEEGLYLIRISNTDYTVTKKVIKVV